MAAGETDLPEIAALIVSAPVLVTMNTGPAHFAAALCTPVVDLYALTNLQHAPWWGRVRFRDVPYRVCLKSVCPEGHHSCFAGIGGRLVGATALEAAAGRARRGRGKRPARAGAVIVVPPVRRLLVVGLPGGLGDVAEARPMFQALARSHPRARVKVLAFASGAALLADDPHVDAVQVAPAGGARAAVAATLANEWDLVVRPPITTGSAR